MLKKERYSRIMAWFEENQPMPTTELHHDSPFHLLIAVILSAQCTDRRVNMVVPPLFERYPKPADLAAATFDEVYPFVKSISYPNSKTEHLIAMARKLVSEFDSEVPSDIDSLMSLP
ncbi:MAG: endonuclease III, partial [Bacteroidales bacterium]|nr:endonuclease III [Bacteroidales bacterium]